MFPALKNKPIHPSDSALSKMGFSIIRFRPYWMGDAGLAPNLQAVGVGKGENAFTAPGRFGVFQAGEEKGPRS